MAAEAQWRKEKRRDLTLNVSRCITSNHFQHNHAVIPLLPLLPKNFAKTLRHRASAAIS